MDGMYGTGTWSLEAIFRDVCETSGTSMISHTNWVGTSSMYKLYQESNQKQEFLVRKQRQDQNKSCQDRTVSVSLLLKYSIYKVYLVCTKSRWYEIIYRLKMSLKLFLAIFLLFSTYFNKSPSVTTVTTRVVTAIIKTRVNTNMVKTKKKGAYYEY